MSSLLEGPAQWLCPPRTPLNSGPARGEALGTVLGGRGRVVGPNTATRMRGTEGRGCLGRVRGDGWESPREQMALWLRLASPCRTGHCTPSAQHPPPGAAARALDIPHTLSPDGPPTDPPTRGPGGHPPAERRNRAPVPPGQRPRRPPYHDGLGLLGVQLGDGPAEALGLRCGGVGGGHGAGEVSGSAPQPSAGRPLKG